MTKTSDDLVQALQVADGSVLPISFEDEDGLRFEFTDAYVHQGRYVIVFSTVEDED
jgi:hypothetical protein